MLGDKRDGCGDVFYVEDVDVLKTESYGAVYTRKSGNSQTACNATIKQLLDTVCLVCRVTNLESATRLLRTCLGPCDRFVGPML